MQTEAGDVCGTSVTVLQNLRCSLSMALSDRVVGLSLLVGSTALFVYYTSWVLLTVCTLSRSLQQLLFTFSSFPRLPSHSSLRTTCCNVHFPNDGGRSSVLSWPASSAWPRSRYSSALCFFANENEENHVISAAFETNLHSSPSPLRRGRSGLRALHVAQHLVAHEICTSASQ